MPLQRLALKSEHSLSVSLAQEHPLSPSRHTVDPLGSIRASPGPFSTPTHKVPAFTLEPLSRVLLTESKHLGLFLMHSGMFQAGSRAEFRTETKTRTGQEYPTVGYCLGPRSHRFTSFQETGFFPVPFVLGKKGRFCTKLPFRSNFEKMSIESASQLSLHVSTRGYRIQNTGRCNTCGF